MCTRYLLLEQHFLEVLKRLGVTTSAEFLSRYNIAPGSAIPAVRQAPATTGRSLREVTGLHWGLVPGWARDTDGARPANARAETLDEKPSFRDALRTRRCVLPASGFYEWEHRGRLRLPWLFRRRDEQPFGLAGLWESWRAPDGEVLESCAVITTAPNELMRPIHHRMPVILAADQFEAWLDPRPASTATLAPLLRPAGDGTLTAAALDTYVNDSRHEGPACLAPASANSGSTPQLSLDF